MQSNAHLLIRSSSLHSNSRNRMRGSLKNLSGRSASLPLRPSFAAASRRSRRSRSTSRSSAGSEAMCRNSLKRSRAACVRVVFNKTNQTQLFVLCTPFAAASRILRTTQTRADPNPLSPLLARPGRCQPPRLPSTGTPMDTARPCQPHGGTQCTPPWQAAIDNSTQHKYTL